LRAEIISLVHQSFTVQGFPASALLVSHQFVNGIFDGRMKQLQVVMADGFMQEHLDGDVVDLILLLEGLQGFFQRVTVVGFLVDLLFDGFVALGKGILGLIQWSADMKIQMRKV